MSRRMLMVKTVCISVYIIIAICVFKIGENQAYKKEEKRLKTIKIAEFKGGMNKAIKKAELSDFYYSGNKITWRTHQEQKDYWWLIPKGIGDEKIQSLNSNPNNFDQMLIFAYTKYWKLNYDSDPEGINWYVEGPIKMLPNHYFYVSKNKGIFINGYVYK